MKVEITDFLIADCELSGKSGVECVKARLDPQTPEAVISTAELVKVLRFQKTQQAKMGSNTNRIPQQNSDA